MYKDKTRVLGEHQVTRYLREIDEGVAGAENRLLECVYDELLTIARVQSRKGFRSETLHPTALVNEAYAKLFNGEPLSFTSREHFFGAAATTMRRLLLDRARYHSRASRGGGWARSSLEGLPDGDAATPDALVDLAEEVIRLSEAIDALEERYPEEARVLTLKHFGGLDNDSVAEITGISSRGVRRKWAFATSWVRDEMNSRIV